MRPLIDLVYDKLLVIVFLVMYVSNLLFLGACAVNLELYGTPITLEQIKLGMRINVELFIGLLFMKGGLWGIRRTLTAVTPELQGLNLTAFLQYQPISPENDLVVRLNELGEI